MKKVIFHLITSLNIGGTEVYLKDLILGMKDDYKHFVGYIKERGPIGRELEERGVTVVRVSTIFKIFKYIKRIKPDIAHTHLYRANILGRIAAYICGIPVISSRQSTDTWRKWHQKLLDILTARFCVKIISNSKKVAQILIEDEKVPANKVEVVYIGVPEDWHVMNVKQKNANVIGYVGRLHYEKGADLLPEFISLLNKKYPGLKVKIAGGGILEGYLSGKLPENCELVGWKEGEELKKFYDSVDIIILLSRLESIPRVIIEAGSRGVPAVAPDIGGIVEFIEDNKNGFIYDALDLERACDKIISFYKSPEKSNEIRCNALIKAKRFTKKGMIREVKSIYKSVCF